jgi:hypothetical protein
VNCFDVIRIPLFLFPDFFCSFYVFQRIRYHYDSTYGFLCSIVAFCVLAGLWHCLWWELGSLQGFA